MIYFSSEKSFLCVPFTHFLDVLSFLWKPPLIPQSTPSHILNKSTNGGQQFCIPVTGQSTEIVRTMLMASVFIVKIKWTCLVENNSYQLFHDIENKITFSNTESICWNLNKSSDDKYPESKINKKSGCGFCKYQSLQIPLYMDVL